MKQRSYCVAWNLNERCAHTSASVCVDFADYSVQTTRCEFVDDDFVSDESEAYLTSSTFISHVPLLVGIIYQISSPHIGLELMIASQSPERALQRHVLSPQKSLFLGNITTVDEPIYLVLHAFTGVVTTSATSSSSSVAIEKTVLLTRHDGQLVIDNFYSKQMRLYRVSQIERRQRNAVFSYH